MQHGAWYAAWTLVCSMDFVTQHDEIMKHELDHATRLTTFHPAPLPGIVVSPVPLVTDWSVSVQLWFSSTIFYTSW
jgi:hypothetical protein